MDFTFNCRLPKNYNIMRKFSLVLGIYITLNLIWSILFDNSSTDKILWFETNIWIVRLIEVFISTVLIYGYFKHSNTHKN